MFPMEILPFSCSWINNLFTAIVIFRQASEKFIWCTAMNDCTNNPSFSFNCGLKPIIRVGGKKQFS